VSEHDMDDTMREGHADGVSADVVESPEHDSDDPHSMTRRDAVKLLGVTGLVGLMQWTSADVTHAATLVRRLEAADDQQFAPKFFTPEEWRTVNILVDYVIPRDAKSGSATDAKVPEFMDFMLTDDQQNVSEATKTAMRNGLAWLDGETRKRFTQPFATATDAQRKQILDDIAYPRRARPEMQDGVTFFNRFRDMTASGFFSSRIGWQDLDYMGNVAVRTWNGCPEPALRKLGVSYALMNTRVPMQNGG
jgi:gluconate 2-dehydrogenase gamma chain